MQVSGHHEMYLCTNPIPQTIRGFMTCLHHDEHVDTPCGLEGINIGILM